MKDLPPKKNDNITFSYYQTTQEMTCNKWMGRERENKEKKSLFDLHVITIFDDDTCDTDEEIIGLQF